MYDLWNPYEGLHQHILSYVATRMANIGLIADDENEIDQSTSYNASSSSSTATEN